MPHRQKLMQIPSSQKNGKEERNSNHSKNGRGLLTERQHQAKAVKDCETTQLAQLVKALEYTSRGRWFESHLGAILPLQIKNL